MSGESRRLAAIMFTDVVGYSRLMAESEQRALGVLERMREVLAAAIASSGGQLHKVIGDGSLSTFASAVDAVRCALLIQQQVREMSEFELRVGLHVGDIVVSGDDVHGDGVNIAARIEPLAPPGGLALSDAVLMQIRGKLELPLRSIGQPNLKNVGSAIEVFVHAPAEEAGPAMDADASMLRRTWAQLRGARVPQWVTGYIALAFGVLQGVTLLADLYRLSDLVGRLAVVVLAWGVPVAAVLAWYHGRPGPQRMHRRELALLAVIGIALGLSCTWQVAHWEEPAAETRIATTAPPVRAALLVMPFENPGGRAEDVYLSEGFSDELRDQLSRVPGMNVVARASSISLHERGSDLAAIAAELGVATVIEGELRHDGTRLRVSVRLVDIASGVQRWSQSYDRTMDNMLDVQQDVALAAATQIVPQLAPQDLPPPLWQANVNDLMLLARNYQQTAVRPQDQERVIELYRQVLEIDPRSAPAHARLGRALFLRGDDVAGAERQLRRALDLDPQLAEAYSILGLVLWSQFEQGAGEMFRRAVQLNPNDAEAARLYAGYLSLQGDPDQLGFLRRARDLDPMSLWNNADLAAFYVAQRKEPEASATIALIAQRFPGAASRVALGRIADTGGQLDESVAWTLEALQLEPDNAIARDDLAEHYARLGLPEESRRIRPEPTLRTLFWERRFAEIIERMGSVDLDEANADDKGFLAFALQAEGRNAEAVEILLGIGLPGIVLDDDLRRWAAVHQLVLLIGSMNATGNIQEARRLAVWLDAHSTKMARLAMGTPRGWFGGYWQACAQVVLGQPGRALGYIEESMAAGSMALYPYMRDTACLRPLRDEPRYRAALGDLEARIARMREQLPATLQRHGIVRNSG